MNRTCLVYWHVILESHLKSLLKVEWTLSPLLLFTLTHTAFLFWVCPTCVTLITAFRACLPACWFTGIITFYKRKKNEIILKISQTNNNAMSSQSLLSNICILKKQNYKINIILNYSVLKNFILIVNKVNLWAYYCRLCEYRSWLPRNDHPYSCHTFHHCTHDHRNRCPCHFWYPPPENKATE